jgi:hypothetical protein
MPKPDLDFGPPVQRHEPAIVPPASSASEPAARPVETTATEPHTPPDVLDPLDTSTISSTFFQRDEDSVPPLIDGLIDATEEPPPSLHFSPETIARRARLRRIVAAVAGLAGVITLAVVGKTVIASAQSSSTSQIAAVPAPTPPQTKADAAAAPVKGEPPQAPPAAQTAAKLAATPAEPAKADAAPAESAAKAEAEEAQAPAADAGKLKKEALSFLNRGKYKEAIESARAAIAADPSDAMPYLYLGSALQDTGKWKDGIAAYSDCVRNATQGPVHECRAMGGRK